MSDLLEFDDFVAVSRGARKALVRREWEGSVGAALLRGEGCTTVASDGRGSLQRFAYDGGAGLIRTYRRGGAIGPLLNDRMFFINRPFRELQLLVSLHDMDLPVPTPLGARWEQSGWVYRGAIATVELPARHLQAVLTEAPDQAHALLPQVGAMIREFHDVGLFHADLQIRNILVGDGAVYLIDFDRARLFEALTPRQRWKNLLRLRRSLEKNGYPVEYFDAICRGYGPEDFPKWLDSAYRVKDRVSDRLQGREAPRS